MNNSCLERGLLLLQQKRHDLAERELRQALAAEPDNATAHSLLGLALAGQEKLPDALEEARLGVHLAPDAAYSHYIHGHVLLNMGKTDEAESAAKEAIQLDPMDPDYYQLLGSTLIQKELWEDAIEAATKGLTVDAEHVGCLNLRALALMRLGRKQEAAHSTAGALAQDPESSLAHANMGWAMLEKSQPRKALDHFRQALQINPHFDWARTGMIEAMKARNPLYRLMLMYFLWSSRLSTKARWGLIIGLLIAVRFFGSVEKGTSGPLRALCVVILGLYVAFVFLTWVASPLFNLTLRLSRFGRLLLSPMEIWGANLVGLCLIIALASTAIYFLLDQPRWIIAAAGAVAMMMPVSATFECDSSRKRGILGIYTVCLAVLGLASLCLSFAHPQANVPAGIFILAFIAFTWLAQFQFQGR
jgi:tetratricopeptide (TPR) repeat protein